MPDSLQFSLFAGFPQISHGFTGRTEDLAAVPGANTLIAKQVHSARIYDLTEQFRGHREVDGYDALVTGQKDITLLIKIADCAPILFFDPRTGTIATVHAGRRGTEQGIARLMTEYLKRKYAVNPADLLVGIGPSICVNCYQIDRTKDLHYDLWQTNREQLMAAGVRRIELSGLCTACNANARFYSYRKDNTERRNFAFIRLNPL